MLEILRLATRNLSRYRRRTLLTLTLIVIGMVAVLLFVAVTGSFKSMMVGQITDSVLGHLEVHRKGYVASIDTLPLNLNISPAAMTKVDDALGRIPAVKNWSPRVKFGAMFSNFTETTSIRVNGIDPAREALTVPLLPGRMIDGRRDGPLLARGEIVIPVLLARGMKTQVGDTVVLVGTNRDGSVNGKTFTVRGILDSVTGPSGRDGYIHIEDARELLRMKDAEVSEVAIRLANLDQVPTVMSQLREALVVLAGEGGQPTIDVHSWADLSPFANVAKMIDVMTVFVKVVLVSIVLVSVMNVMVMAVYERIREIGTIAAIGTPPGRILALFLSEGVLLGVIGTAVGTAVSMALIWVLNLWQVRFDFGMQQDLILAPTITIGQIAVIEAMVIGVALLASLQPAWNASRLDPIHALRHV